MTRTRGIRVTEELDREVALEAENRGTTWSAMSQQLLGEALKMRRAPGVVFVDGPAGRRGVELAYGSIGGASNSRIECRQ
jgi:hypothetical protein